MDTTYIKTLLMAFWVLFQLHRDNCLYQIILLNYNFTTYIYVIYSIGRNTTKNTHDRAEIREERAIVVCDRHGARAETEAKKIWWEIRKEWDRARMAFPTQHTWSRSQLDKIRVFHSKS